MQTQFLLGELKITPDARRALRRLPYDLVARHAICEHGVISPSERRANELGLRTLGRIISRYRSDPTNQHSDWVVVVTEPTWRCTNIYLEARSETAT
jgi:hypothetical protein